MYMSYTVADTTCWSTLSTCHGTIHLGSIQGPWVSLERYPELVKSTARGLQLLRLQTGQGSCTLDFNNDDDDDDDDDEDDDDDDDHYYHYCLHYQYLLLHSHYPGRGQSHASELAATWWGPGPTVTPKKEPQRGHGGRWMRWGVRSNKRRYTKRVASLFWGRRSSSLSEDSVNLSYNQRRYLGFSTKFTFFFQT